MYKPDKCNPFANKYEEYAINAIRHDSMEGYLYKRECFSM